MRGLQGAARPDRAGSPGRAPATVRRLSPRPPGARITFVVMTLIAVVFAGGCAMQVTQPAPSKTALPSPTVQRPETTTGGRLESGLGDSRGGTPAAEEPAATGGKSLPGSERGVPPGIDNGSVAAAAEAGNPAPAGGATAGAIPQATAPLSPSPAPTATPAPAQPTTRTIALDPGHGGPESGASAEGLVEKAVNLKIALKLADLLRAQGYRVVLTRDSDRAVSPAYKGGGYGGGVARDLQARIDIANAASADLFLSIHNNGSTDPAEKGTEVWYDKERTFADRNLALANMVEDALLKRISGLGYPDNARGIKDDSSFRIYKGRTYNIYVLGPGTGARPHTPTKMPGVLGESLFVSNAADATMLRQERTLEAIAAGYRDAIVSYFQRFPS